MLDIKDKTVNELIEYLNNITNVIADEQGLDFELEIFDEEDLLEAIVDFRLGKVFDLETINRNLEEEVEQLRDTIFELRGRR